MSSVSKSVDQVIHERRTTKVMSEQALPVASAAQDWNELLELAAWAPFHRPAHAHYLKPENPLNGIMPWRFHVLDAANCRALREKLQDREIGKIGEMLATADLLILATWLPTPATESTPVEHGLFAATLENMEHIAAAAAAIQNLLLGATSRDIPNYWSSGGVLREADVFGLCGISTEEILLGAIFLFPAQPGEQASTAFSKMHDQRSPLSAWTRYVSLS